jgi:hypothetical protein
MLTIGSGTPESIAEELVSDLKGTKFYQASLDATLRAIRTSALTFDVIASNCSGQVPTGRVLGAQFGAQGAGAVASFTQAGTSTAATGALGVAGVVSLFAAPLLLGLGFAFASHARAVARENQTLCAAIPEANAAIAEVESAFQSGRVSAEEAAQALGRLLSTFKTFVSVIRKQCNAACGFERQLEGIVRYRSQEYLRIETARKTAAKSSSLPAVSGGVTVGGATSAKRSEDSGIAPILVAAGILLAAKFL